MKKLFITFAIFALSLFGFSTQAFATNNLTQFGKTEANILTGCAESDDGIMCIIELVRDILSIGVGILGVIGISVVGIQYLTAGGNEEKTRKAKRRMFEIVLGLVVYAVLAALVSFLGINSESSSGSDSGSSGSSSETTTPTKPVRPESGSGGGGKQYSIPEVE